MRVEVKHSSTEADCFLRLLIHARSFSVLHVAPAEGVGYIVSPVGLISYYYVRAPGTKSIYRYVCVCLVWPC